jgi:hypothetical protein
MCTMPNGVDHYFRRIMFMATYLSPEIVSTYFVSDLSGSAAGFSSLCAGDDNGSDAGSGVDPCA